MSKIFARNLICVLLFGIIFSACGPVTSVPTVPPIRILPSTITPSPSRLPTSTVIPSPTQKNHIHQPVFVTSSPTATVTPFPALLGSRPYLMFEQEWRGKKFVIYDANGTGRKFIELPPDGYILGRTQGKAISPDRQWLVFHTGSYESNDSPENLPITLKLLNINDGTIKEVTNIVIDGYKEKLNQVAEELKRLDPDWYKPLDGDEWVNQIVSNEFFWSIYSVAWSPDSQSLAFAAQIDGLSSDVYVYELESEKITRVEDSLQSVSWITWSPDGNQIVFGNAIPGPIYTGMSLHSVKFGGQMVKEPKTIFEDTWPYIGDWLSPTTLLVAYGTDTAGPYHLMILDINTGQAKSLWSDFFGSYEVDLANQVILVNASSGPQFEELGLYIIAFDGKQRKILDGYYELTLFFRGGKEHRFLMQGGTSKDKTWIRYPIDGDVVAIGLDGKLTNLGKFDWDKISISPDYTWLIMYNEKELFLYDENDELIRTFQIPKIHLIIWRPDSQAIFYSAGNQLFTLSVPDGEPKLIDACPYCALDDAVWLP